MFHIYVICLMGLMSLYIIARVIIPARPGWKWGLALSLLTLLAAQKLELIRLFTRGVSVTWLHGEGPLIVSTSLVQSALVCLMLLALARDLCLLACRGFRRETLSVDERIRKNRRAAWLMLALSLVLSAYGTWSAVRLPPVRELTLHVPGLPAKLDGLRLVQLTDLHIGPINGRDWAERLVERVNGLEADLIAITGDVIDGPVRNVAPDLEPFTRLAAPAFLAPGNHEYYSGFESWMETFRRLGLRVLHNEAETLDRQGARLLVAGLADPAGYPRPDLPAVLAAANGAEDRQTPLILLAHNPREAADNAATFREMWAGPAVQLSGHTHGAQMWPLQPLVARFNGGFVEGLYQLDGLQLYVHPGVGVWAGFPLRLGAPPEIALITLRAS